MTRAPGDGACSLGQGGETQLFHCLSPTTAYIFFQIFIFIILSSPTFIFISILHVGSDQQ